ncbi:hypothetical protein FHS27_000874 [Rhodopirellula rubra]|uniref:Uncharacterized protein n=1 Tax=Aporhodopirellula rubra TaxID=980271 RepID=A0A7W5DVT4_9BACT|nr:hypothetical protein [Aporhodopirellula rubra]MBB3205107.1 hypothetical protein [Aporhodopirellula rubra]
MARDGEWFEMKSMRKRRMRTASWIPLYQEIEKSERQWPEIDFEEDVVVTRAAIFPSFVDKLREQLSWNELHCANGNRPEANEGMYSPARELWNHHVQQNDEFVDGEFLIFEHHTSSGREIMVSPDLICALKLERLGDSWVYALEGYGEVIRNQRSEDGTIHTVEIRAKHLKDYLCARKSQLVIGTFRSRCAILHSKPDFQFADTRDESSWYEFGVREINEDGGCYGQPFAISAYGFAETDHDDDVPVYKFDDERETWRKRHDIDTEGRKLYRVGCEMVLMETVPPADASPIVRGDDVVPTVRFVVDNDDSRLTAVDLIRPPNRWIWFSPSLVTTVLSFSRTRLRWASADTGFIDIPGHEPVHFGVNKRELINFFAKDVGELPLWWQERFVSHNVPPDGGVCPELTAAQMECRPARTTAAETKLAAAAERLDQAVSNAFGQPLFKEHAAQARLWGEIHRFAAPDEPAFFALAKNIVRTIVERMDMELLKSRTSNMDKKTGSLKRLAKIIDEAGGDGFSATTMLVGLNELRQRDSHLPSEKDLDDAYQFAGIVRTESPMIAAKKLIENTAGCVHCLATIVEGP